MTSSTRRRASTTSATPGTRRSAASALTPSARPSSSAATPAASSGRATPDIPPRYEVVAANRTYVYAVDDRDFPVDVLSSHKDKDDAWTAFYEAIEQPCDDIILLRDITPAQTVIASSDEDIYSTAVA